MRVLGLCDITIIATCGDYPSELVLDRFFVGEATTVLFLNQVVYFFSGVLGYFRSNNIPYGFPWFPPDFAASSIMLWVKSFMGGWVSRLNIPHWLVFWV